MTSTTSKVTESSLENSSVKTTNGDVTHNYYGNESQLPRHDNNATMKAQLDRIEQKLDFLIQQAFK